MCMFLLLRYRELRLTIDFENKRIVREDGATATTTLYLSVQWLYVYVYLCSSPVRYFSALLWDSLVTCDEYCVHVRHC